MMASKGRLPGKLCRLLLAISVIPGVALAEEAAAAQEAQATSQTQVELKSGDTVEITFSSLPDYIDLSQDPAEANRIPAKLLTNPQLADIFVPGLFTPPAAGGPELDAAEKALTDLAEPLAVDPALTAQQDSAIAAAILFREFVDVKIVPTFLTQDIQNTTINATGR
ncbi:hypothetical protein AAIA72_03585 [Hahella sp. SMD15-11]|uniref:Uncharacterized protein n=1 Tax=Thermohahella caldifontis TaxID=3142973 RepID=A0AB39UXK8_9GAMM